MVHVDSEIPKRNLRPRRSKITIDPAISLVFQTTVLDTPELLHHITNYLTLADIQKLTCVCRKWNNYWTPYAYSRVYVSKYRRTRIYPKFHKYGEYIKDLRIRDTKDANIAHILEFTPNVRTLVISHGTLNSGIPLIIASLVPQLRVLHLHFINLGPLMSTVATLVNLERLSFEKSYQGLRCMVHIDELLNIIKNCTKLKSLTISRLNLVEEFPEDHQVEVQRVDDEGWVNSSLNTLNCENILLGPRVSNVVQLEIPHASIRRLYQHLPNLTTIRFNGKSNLLASDWKFIFKNRHEVHTVDVSCPLANYFRVHQEQFYGTECFNSIEKCGNIKSLNINDVTASIDEEIAAIIRNNQEIKMVTAKYTGFGDKALKELAYLPNPNTLTELHLWMCKNVTYCGAALILENCSSLKCLNIVGTSAGTIELFKSTKSWVCTLTLKLLCIDIQPNGFRPSPTFNRSPPEIIRYNDDEEEMIRNRLHSFTSLIVLEIKGQAMSMNIIRSLSFAPDLQKVIVEILYKPVGVDGGPRDQYEAASQHARGLGEQLSLGGTTYARASYTGSAGILSCLLNTTRNANMPVINQISDFSHANYLENFFK